MFLIQCYNSTASLGYPPTCNEAVIYLSTLENPLQNRPSWKCKFFYGLALTRIKAKLLCIPWVALLVSKLAECLRLFFIPKHLVMLITVYQANARHRAVSFYNESNAQKKIAFKCWSCHVLTLCTNNQVFAHFALPSSPMKLYQILFAPFFLHLKHFEASALLCIVKGILLDIRLNLRYSLVLQISNFLTN